ncbi:hypothetical protein [Oscillibacter sp.]|uniref:hypothetical protein n=1 Tax=Oscillibacter sp. TaxID=1945593 RepID=UPI002D7E6093|nr:hypothetical protein [Oscillibacter sp.]
MGREEELERIQRELQDIRDREVRAARQRSMDYREVYQLLRVSPFQKVKNEREMYFEDRLLTREQKTRDALITKLLRSYVYAYEKKVWHSVICRYLILAPCMGIIVSFAWALGVFFRQLTGAPAGIEMTEMVSFVTACVSFLGLVVSVLLIITKYFFPENDEQYITQIVKSIQENDLANKRENAKNGWPGKSVAEESDSKVETIKSEEEF